jgi:hypothetical protein
MSKRRTLDQMKEELIGKRFGRVLITGHTKGNYHNMWIAHCDCGKEFITRDKPLVIGKTKSCGCLRNERMTMHGMSGTRTYYSWRCMIKRCEDRKNKDFHSYGARGISVCKEWRNSFEQFYKDMGERPSGKTLDRINVNGNYCKENCRWANPKEQSSNKRKSISNEA